MKPIKLTICICSLHDRSALLSRLLNRLAKQKRLGEVQILINVDDGQNTIGVKRNYMINDALGAYVCHVDDDDLVSPDYVESIMNAIDAHPEADAIAIRGKRTDVWGRVEPTVFDFRLAPSDEVNFEGGVLWRSPGHLCPIRTSIVRTLPFPEIEPEDIVWCARVRPHIKTVVRASDDVLYFYLWDSQKVYQWQR